MSSASPSPSSSWRFASGAVCVALVLLSIKPSEQHEEHVEVAFKQVSLEDICANRQVPIVSVSEASRLIRELRAEPDKCPEKYLQSMFELEPILSVSRDLLLCSEKKFNQIKDYHFRYVNPKVEAYKLGDDLNHLGKVIKPRPLHEEKFDYTVQLDDYKQEILIPISVQQFFKAWTLQASGLCKVNFVSNLEAAMNDYMDVLDVELIEEFGSASKPNPITGAPLTLTFNELVYLPELEGEREEGDLVKRADETILNLANKPRLNEFMHACKPRFRPVYEKLVLPVVKLAKLGYDYQGAKIDGIRSQLEANPLIRRWLAVTSICESVGNFDLIESDDEGEQVDFKAIDYEPKLNLPFGDTLWILGAEALRNEFAAISGSKATGFKRFLFNAAVGGRKLVAALDPHQFRFYRRNQNSISSALNLASLTVTSASTALSLAGGK